jgi:hypothetical protein
VALKQLLNSGVRPSEIRLFLPKEFQSLRIAALAESHKLEAIDNRNGVLEWKSSCVFKTRGFIYALSEEVRVQLEYSAVLPDGKRTEKESATTNGKILS